jgi:hypothetical protein
MTFLFTVTISGTREGRQKRPWCLYRYEWGVHASGRQVAVETELLRQFSVLRMALASCHHSGAMNFEEVSRFFENVCTLCMFNCGFQ